MRKLIVLSLLLLASCSDVENPDPTKYYRPTEDYCDRGITFCLRSVKANVNDHIKVCYKDDPRHSATYTCISKVYNDNCECFTEEDVEAYRKLTNKEE